MALFVAWHGAAFTRVKELKPFDKILNRNAGSIDFDKGDALAGALDRLVVRHQVIDAALDEANGQG